MLIIVSLSGWLSDAWAEISFSVAQAENGKAIYATNCARCHAVDLGGAEFGPPLVGEAFVRHWAGRPIEQLFLLIKTTMPPSGSSHLPDSEYIDIIAYLFEAYHFEPGAIALPDTLKALRLLSIPDENTMKIALRIGGSRLSNDVALPSWSEAPNPLERMRAVTNSALEHPDDGNWLTWRRTSDAAGFSPLREVSTRNASRLRVAWSLALPAGPNEATPLVNDGVMFIHSYDDHIIALNAATGDELWHYYHEHGPITTVHRNIALYEDRLYFTSSDAHLVALAAKSGRKIWEASIGDPERGIVVATGGPLIAQGIVMQGLNGGGSLGGAYIVGLDANTGQVLWHFNTVARPGELGGNSWNNLPLEKRSGGSVWTSGTYLAKYGLALFGPAPTYETQVLREKSAKTGVTNNALYTDATIALEPRTGRLVWYFQHFPNDQWDLDWAFERQILDLKVKGEMRTLVLTAGKEAVYDALDAKTGAYQFSFDLGIQNLIKSIDPKTGDKEIDLDLVPGEGRNVTVCPHAAGAKSWLPGSYDEQRKTLYVPLVESCMTIGSTHRGADWSTSSVTIRPRPDSDGKYGRLQAIDLGSMKTIWINRQRSPQTTGALATAGGLVFAGALDRWFTAYAADNGKMLWRTRLSDVPNAAPISYLANNQQYVAVVVGSGFGQTETFLPLVPEIRSPIARSSAIWVFSLAE